MKYRYFYQTKDNENKEGWIKAKSRENAYALLRKSGIRPYRVVGDDPVNWKPYAAGTAIVLLATALAATLLLGREDAAPRPRAQLEGDRGAIAAGVYSGWTNVLSSALDRRLAQLLRRTYHPRHLGEGNRQGRTHRRLQVPRNHYRHSQR